MLDERSLSLHLENLKTEPFHHLEFQRAGIAADVLRLDKIHNVISGNKWFKLKEYLEDAVQHSYRQVLTFGGAYSNHLIATAFACRSLGLASIGVIRGEPAEVPSSTLLAASFLDMDLVYVNRNQYAKKHLPEQLDALKSQFPDAYIIPEGGSGEAGIRGAGEIVKFIPKKTYSHILCAVGTGTTMQGIAARMEPGQQIIGIPILKIAVPRRAEWESTLHLTGNYRMFYDYHFGGYAKKRPDLFDFMNDLFRSNGIPTDFVYTARMMFAGVDLARQKYFAPGSRLLFVHSGGLQGNRSLEAGTLVF